MDSPEFVTQCCVKVMGEELWLSDGGGARKKKGYVWEVTTDNKDMDKESGDGDRQPETLCSSWIELG